METTKMYKIFAQVMKDWFVMLRYKWHWDVEILQPQEILDYVKETPKEKLISDLERIIKLTDKF